MKYIKKYTAIQISSYKDTREGSIKVDLTFGRVRFYDDSISETFDTEEEAIEHAYNVNKYGQWLIIPKISFNYIDEN